MSQIGRFEVTMSVSLFYPLYTPFKFLWVVAFTLNLWLN